MTLTLEQASVALGMLQRGDKQHDIAAYFGENPGRIIDVKFGRGKFAGVQPAAPETLPVRAGGHPYMSTTTAMTAASPVALLIHETMDLVEQIKVLDELIATTPPNSPTVVLTLSVALIQHILENRNNHNRKARRAKIKRFAADMSNGFWMLTGDTVKFGANGELLDGQNRLRAAMTSGAPLTTHVVFGIDPVAFKFLDSGTVRTGGDTFMVAGVPNAEIAGKATRWLLIFDDPKMERGVTVANADLFEHYTKRVNKDLLQQQIVKAKAVSKVIPTGVLAAMLYLFERKDADKAKIFAHDLEKEVRAGRTLLTRLRTLKRDNLGRMNEKTVTAFAVLAWNHFRQTGNNSIHAGQLRWTDAEPHPVIE
jgi:hypothetical protein